MKRILCLLLAGAVSIGISRAALQKLAPEGPALSRYLPAGALLQLQARNFAAILKDFNASPEKKKWLESSNYEVFSRSRLLLRLQSASDQFAAAAGLPPDMDFLAQVAGSHSTLALYDIGNLEFLYITHLPSNGAVQTALWQQRAKFEPRSAGDATFYFRSEPESGRQVAFAVHGEYLLLATREDLLAGALQLMTGSKDQSIEGEAWWLQAAGSAAAEGDLRLLLNLEKIVPSPYFRSYWIQRNVTELKQYSAAVSDLFIRDQEFREERVLLRKAPASIEAAAADGAQAVAELARLVPSEAAVYQTKSIPTLEECAAALETKLLAPHSGPVPPSQLAPQFQLASGEVGNAADLETRIDVAAVTHEANASASTASAIFDKNRARAFLQMQSTERNPGNVFVRFRTVLVFLGETDWDAKAAEAILAAILRPGLTTGDLGIAWQSKDGYRELDGLHKFFVAVRGKYFFVGDHAGLLESALARLNEKTLPQAAVFLGGFQHKLERNNFARLAAALDRGNAGPGEAEGEERMPQFFSNNIASLSAVLGRVAGARIVVRDAGSRVTQTVTYEWQP